ncbi:MAG: flavodoxin family protein, partial [Armatimonadia bacterium]|nr:flavodoxin family protein [Armatimonadia bacterium]
MKVVAFNGSPRVDGNTNDMLRLALEPIEEAGHETELVQLATRSLRGCIACFKCAETQNGRCAIDDDGNECIQKMLQADAILLGSPTYFADVTAEMKGLIDRA